MFQTFPKTSTPSNKNGFFASATKALFITRVSETGLKLPFRMVFQRTGESANCSSSLLLFEQQQE